MHEDSHMTKPFILYRSQLLFTGLTTDEMMKVESVFNRYSVFYKENVGDVGKLENFALICMTLEDFEKNKNQVLESKIPFFILGPRGVVGCAGFISRDAIVRLWLESIQSITPPVRVPQVEELAVGVVVKSKTTPVFGKGIVIKIVSDHEVLVRFPTTNLLTKDKSIRCHRSQLQILGRLEDLK